MIRIVVETGGKEVGELYVEKDFSYTIFRKNKLWKKGKIETKKFDGYCVWDLIHQVLLNAGMALRGII